jgi:prepilin-type N-terminal cleavage/methylation domain-containing protein
MRASDNRDDGFSLIEVLVAMTLLAVSLAAFYPAFSNAAYGLVRSEDRLLASVFARSLMEQTLATRRLTPGATSGTDGPYRWTLTTTLREAAVDPTPDSAPKPPQPGPTSAQSASPQTTTTQATWLLYDLVLDVSWSTPPRSLRLQTVHLAQEARR